MIDSSAIKAKKIAEINSQLTKQPLYNQLFSILGINVDEDFMQAELLLNQVEIGSNFVKISEPTVKLLDFFKKNGFRLHTMMPAYESETYKNPIIAWLVLG